MGGWEYMVQIEAASTPECHRGVPSPGGQREEENRVIHFDYNSSLA